MWIMSDSIELRKRILKMRENNYLNPKNIQSININNQDSNLIQTKKKNIPEKTLNILKSKNGINNNNCVL